MSLVLTYITNPTEEAAKKLAKHLLEKKLIACANIFPIHSMYWWKEEIADEQEFVVLAKTTDEMYDPVKAEVEKIHSYEVPCVIKINADANNSYLNWLEGEVKKQ